jgi:hypothetical protein
LHLRLSLDDPAAYPLGAPSLLPAPQHQPPARSQRRACGQKKKLKVYPIGYFHIDLTEVRTAEEQTLPFRGGRPHFQVRLRPAGGTGTSRKAAEFLGVLIETVPYQIHTVLTDHGTHFTTLGNARSAACRH